VVRKLVPCMSPAKNSAVTIRSDKESKRENLYYFHDLLLMATKEQFHKTANVTAPLYFGFSVQIRRIFVMKDFIKCGFIKLDTAFQCAF
jgi:hypothetical protein